jgi:hypothetical protein
MQMNAKIVVGSLAGVAVLHAVLAACAGKATANADPSPSVEAVDEVCDKPLPIVMGTGIGYAEHAYPGLTRDQVAGHVTVWDVVTSPEAVQIPSTGYDRILNTRTYVRDGFMGVNCQTNAKVTFVYSP